MKYNIFLGLPLNTKLGKNFTHLTTFYEFKSFLNSVHFEQIRTVVFGRYLEAEDDDDVFHVAPGIGVVDITSVFNIVDCCNLLIEKARGKQLPQCFTIGDNTSVSEPLDHYTKSYKFTNYCGKIDSKPSTIIETFS